MTQKKFFPASPVDELTYCVEKIDRNPLIQGWILALEGEVCSRSLTAALDASLRRYPKFTCTMTGNYPSLQRWFRYRWELHQVQAADIFREIADSGTEAVSYYIEHHPSLAMDISSQAPLRVILIRQPKQCGLIFIFHHAAVDGMGGFYFIQHVIQAYEAIFYQKNCAQAAEPEYDAISLPRLTFRREHFTFRRMRAYMRYTALMRKEPAAPLRPEDGVPGSGALVAVVRKVFPPQFDHIRTAARSCRATINDYLLTAMFRTIRQWNRQTTPAERIYITVPVNLRARGDRTMGNHLSGFNISLRSGLIGTRQATLPLVQQDLAAMMQNEIARTTVNLAWVLKLFPLKLKDLFYRQLPRLASPTISLSNLGVLSFNPSRRDSDGFEYMGPARILDVTGIPPAGQWVGVVALTYNNIMTLSLTSLRAQFSAEAATRLLDAFTRELNE